MAMNGALTPEDPMSKDLTPNIRPPAAGDSSHKIVETLRCLIKFVGKQPDAFVEIMGLQLDQLKIEMIKKNKCTLPQAAAVEGLFQQGLTKTVILNVLKRELAKYQETGFLPLNFLQVCLNQVKKGIEENVLRQLAKKPAPGSARIERKKSHDVAKERRMIRGIKREILQCASKEGYGDKVVPYLTYNPAVLGKLATAKLELDIEMTAAIAQRVERLAPYPQRCAAFLGKVKEARQRYQRAMNFSLFWGGSCNSKPEELLQSMGRVKTDCLKEFKQIVGSQGQSIRIRD